jgi:hypothetical protein
MAKASETQLPGSGPPLDWQTCDVCEFKSSTPLAADPALHLAGIRQGLPVVIANIEERSSGHHARQLQRQ